MTCHLHMNPLPNYGWQGLFITISKHVRACNKHKIYINLFLLKKEPIKVYLREGAQKISSVKWSDFVARRGKVQNASRIKHKIANSTGTSPIVFLAFPQMPPCTPHLIYRPQNKSRPDLSCLYVLTYLVAGFSKAIIQKVRRRGKKKKIPLPSLVRSNLGQPSLFLSLLFLTNPPLPNPPKQPCRHSQ